MLALQLATVAFLIVLNGFFAMAELAVVSARRPRLAAMAEQGNAGARAALRLLRPAQTTITLTSLFSYGEPLGRHAAAIAER
jgi:putative hemolysin